ELMTKSRFQNYALSSPRECRRSVFSRSNTNVIHFPGYVNREEGGEGNPIRLHDPEANGTWEQRWERRTDRWIATTRMSHSERKKDTHIEKARQRENLCPREDEEGRREDECERERERVGEPRDEREREGRTMYHHEVRRRGGRNAADAEQKRSALSAMLFAGITVSNLSLSLSLSLLLVVSSCCWYLPLPLAIRQAPNSRRGYARHSRDIVVAQREYTGCSVIGGARWSENETVFSHNARSDRAKAGRNLSHTSCIYSAINTGPWIRAFAILTSAVNVTSNEFHVPEEDLSIDEALLMEQLNDHTSGILIFLWLSYVMSTLYEKFLQLFFVAKKVYTFGTKSKRRSFRDESIYDTATSINSAKFKLRTYIVLVDDDTLIVSLLCSTALYDLKEYIPDGINTGNAKIKLNKSDLSVKMLSCHSLTHACVYLPNKQLFLVIHPPRHHGRSCKMEKSYIRISIGVERSRERARGGWHVGTVTREEGISRAMITHRRRVPESRRGAEIGGESTEKPRVHAKITNHVHVWETLASFRWSRIRTRLRQQPRNQSVNSRRGEKRIGALIRLSLRSSLEFLRDFARDTSHSALLYIYARTHLHTHAHIHTHTHTHTHAHTPCKLMVQVVLLPLSSTTTLVAAAMFESQMRYRPVARRDQPLSDALELTPTCAQLHERSRPARRAARPLAVGWINRFELSVESNGGSTHGMPSRESVYRRRSNLYFG
ncbi:hypothetical protein ALC62_14258, partial [Cyphomyrmex costatus]